MNACVALLQLCVCVDCIWKIVRIYVNKSVHREFATQPHTEQPNTEQIK